jgi:hypothetical protein
VVILPRSQLVLDERFIAFPKICENALLGGGYGDETKGDETKIRKLWRNASHISFVESNNFRNFPRSGMGNKTKIK